MQFNDDSFLRTVRKLAENSENIVWTRHALERMSERSISTRQVINCLKNGVIHEPVSVGIKGDSKATLRRRSAGTDVFVAVAIDLERSLIIVTTYEN